MYTTRRDIKLSFNRPKYEKNGNVVKCTLNYNINVPAMFSSKNDAVIASENVLAFPMQTAVGIATCSEADEFNKKTGREIAEARAEAAAYQNAEFLVKTAMKNIIDIYENALTAFSYKADAVRLHNSQYVAKLANIEG